MRCFTRPLTCLPAMALLCGSMVLLHACESSVPPPSSQTVVVNLEKVADVLGYNKAIQARYKQVERRLNARLIEAAEGLKKQLDDEKARMGDDPTEEQQAKYKVMQRLAAENVQKNKALAQNRARQVPMALIQQFRQEAIPVVKAVALRYGAQVVLSSGGTLVWSDPTADITDEVIEEMRADLALRPSPILNPPLAPAVVPQGPPAPPQGTPAAPEGTPVAPEGTPAAPEEEAAPEFIPEPEEPEKPAPPG